MTATMTKKTTPTGQTVLDRPNAETTAATTPAKIDPNRCVTAGAGEDLRGCVWVAVVGRREDVSDDPAKRMAELYAIGEGKGGIIRAVGPMPDDGKQQPPGDPAAVQARAVVGQDEYLQRAAEVNVSKTWDKCVCFYLIRAMAGS